MIKVTGGEDALVTALITENDEIVESAGFHLYDEELTELAYAEGQLDDKGLYFEFHIPAEVTRTLKGRYLYTICDGAGSSRCFYQPILIV